MGSLVPHTSAQTRTLIGPILRSAAEASHPMHERAVIDTAIASGAASDGYIVDRALSPREARRLHDEARRAYTYSRDLRRAFDLEWQAFGANPNDAEIAGQLALLHLRTSPSQPARARLLALHALGLRTAAFPAGRAEDWITFAIASALSDRAVDATHALYAALAIGRSAELVCNAALGAFNAHGERLREPVEALLARLRQQGRVEAGSRCDAPQRYVEWRYR